jgi:hypothetical protein
VGRGARGVELHAWRRGWLGAMVRGAGQRRATAPTALHRPS